jgi:biotin synthase
MDSYLTRLGRAAVRGQGLSRQAAIELMGGRCDLYDLMYWANRVREARHGRRVKFCGILSAKQGQCTEDCRFCAQSARYRTGSAAFPLRSLREMVEAAAKPSARFCDSFGLVTSGLGPKRGREWERLLRAFRRVADAGGPSACASLGVLDESAARQLAESGVRRYNHNLETSRRHFPSICTTHSYDDRVATIRAARDAGLQVCSGGIFGMGETLEDRVDMAMELRKLNVHSIPINFLNPVPGTPLAHVPPPTPRECLRIVAVYRLVFPSKDIKLAGGRETALRDLQSWMFYAGANGAILGNYLTTSGRDAEDDLRMVEDLGLEAVPEGAEAP